MLFRSDRGQGILKTLRQVKPELANDQKALKVAFTEVISGRAPEARGNGLKFVRKIVEENPFSLLFQTGNAELRLERADTKLRIKETDKSFHGCMAVINF